jgi:FkbM family methyltransferase
LCQLAASNNARSLAFATGLGSFSHVTASSAREAGTEVATATLDSLLDERPSTIKIDIEGAEPEAIQARAQQSQNIAPS